MLVSVRVLCISIHVNIYNHVSTDLSLTHTETQTDAFLSVFMGGSHCACISIEWCRWMQPHGSDISYHSKFKGAINKTRELPTHMAMVAFEE